MQALALDQRQPVALEIAATATSRQFLVRAEQTVALRALSQQIQARYPQAVIAPATTDPLALAVGEECTVMELRPGAASFLPLRTWKPREWLEEGADPLLGILAACGGLPEGVRIVSQLALVPASPTWSAGLRRYALEHPLAKEHTQVQQNLRGHSIKEVLLLLPIALLLLAVYAFGGRLPRWLLLAGAAVLEGRAPQLTDWQWGEVIVGGIVLLLVVLGGIVLLLWVLVRFGPQLYDPRLADEKTARPAYRTRLRLYVFSPGVHAPAPASAGEAGRITAFFARLAAWIDTLNAGLHRPLDRHTAARAWLAWRASRRKRRLRHQAAQQLRRHIVRETRARRDVRADLLHTLAAAYRQYHLAAGGYFIARTLSARRTRLVLARPARQWFRRVGWAADVGHSTHLLSVADLAAL
jgi:hypothetical protein